MDNDKGKSPVDVSDQLASYNSALRRCNEWYRKLMIEVIWGTSLVIAHYLYILNCVNCNGMTITAFIQSVISSLLEEGTSSTSGAGSSKRQAVAHHLIIHQTKNRARCVNCYKLNGKQGKIINRKKVMASHVITICDTCDGNPHFCKICFNKKH